MSLDITLLPQTLPVMIEEDAEDATLPTFFANVLSPRIGCASKLVALTGVCFFLTGAYVGIH